MFFLKIGNFYPPRLVLSTTNHNLRLKKEDFYEEKGCSFYPGSSNYRIFAHPVFEFCPGKPVRGKESLCSQEPLRPEIGQKARQGQGCQRGKEGGKPLRCQSVCG
jgi:hypothetical protein